MRRKKKKHSNTQRHELSNEPLTQLYAVNKYQLSLIDPRDKIVLYTELDNLRDKLQRSSVGARRYCQLS